MFATLFSRNRKWVNTGFSNALALPLALVVLVAAIVLVYRDGVLYGDARAGGSPDRTDRLRPRQSLLSGLKDAETGQRGYLLTGRPEYLDPYNSALSVIRRDLEQLNARGDAPREPGPHAAPATTGRE